MKKEMVDIRVLHAEEPDIAPAPADSAPTSGKPAREMGKMRDMADEMFKYMCLITKYEDERLI